MTEAVVVNLFLTVRVLLVGGILIALPSITRKGLLFGAYVGETLADRDAAQRLRESWYIGCVILMLLSLLVGYGISLAGRPVTGNLTGTAVLLSGGLVLYLLTYSKARKLAPPLAAHQAERATAPLVAGVPKGAGLAKFALGATLLASLATYAYAVGSYQDMLASVPAYARTAFYKTIWLPSVNLALSPFFGLLALFTANAKRSLRGGSGGGSLEAQDAFRTTFANVASWTALLICAFTSYLSVQIIRVGPSQVRTLWLEILLMAVFVVVFLGYNLFRIMKDYGQGGALLEAGSAEAPLTNGIADNARWIWGLFYVDWDDPSIMVESRFGIGYTLNYGNPTAILVVAGFLVLSLALTAVAVIGTLVGGG
jgi:hypothetical protein